MQVAVSLAIPLAIAALYIMRYGFEREQTTWLTLAAVALACQLAHIIPYTP